MQKLIQTVFLAAVVCSPLSLLALANSASAHHTSSHVSTVSLETSLAKRKKKNKRSNATKKPSSMNGAMKKKAPATDATSTTDPTTNTSDTPVSTDGSMKKKTPATGTSTTTDPMNKPAKVTSPGSSLPINNRKPSVPTTTGVDTTNLKKKIPSTDATKLGTPASAPVTNPLSGGTSIPSNIKPSVPSVPSVPSLPSLPSLPTLPTGLPK